MFMSGKFDTCQDMSYMSALMDIDYAEQTM